MLPRLKLIQCFTCKNNLDCWGLREDIPLGKDENAYSIKSKSLTFLIANSMEDGKLNIKEQFGMFCAAFLQTLRYDSDSDLREINQIVNVMCACSNSSGMDWRCPGEDEKSDEKFVYDER